jgi:hypothetical protein
MFALIGYLLCRNLKLALSAIRRPLKAPAWLMTALRGVAGREEFRCPIEAVPRPVSLRDTSECVMTEMLLSKRLTNYISALTALPVKGPVGPGRRIIGTKLCAAGRADSTFSRLAFSAFRQSN